jgi:hypothetical protein
MDKDVLKAMEDVTLIKRIIQRTKEDVTKIAVFFIWIGIINFFNIVLNLLVNVFIVPTGANNTVLQVINYVKFIVIFAGYILIFLCYRRVMKSCTNDISLGLIKIWGIIFLGLFIFTFLYRNFIPKTSLEFYYTLLTNIIVFQFVSVILGCYMIGIFTKRKLIVICSTVISILFFALFFSRSYYNTKFGYEIAYSDILMDFILSIGLFLLGLYLKRQPGGVLDGDSINTGSISD